MTTLEERDQAIRDCQWSRWFTLQNRLGLIQDSLVEYAFMFAALYNHSHPLGFGYFHYNSEIMSVEEACYILQANVVNNLRRNWRFDYFRGRVLKVDLEDSDYDLYDRDNGLGAAEAAIACSGCDLCKGKDHG